MGYTFCIFSALFLPSTGGVENYTFHLAETLSKNGYRIIIVTNNLFDLPPKEELDPLITIYRLPCFGLLNKRFPLPKPTKLFNGLLSELKSESIDFVVINTRFYIHSLIAAKFADSKNITPILIDHGSAYLTMNNKLLNCFIRIYEHFITSCLKRYHIKYYGVSKASSKWLKNFGITSHGEINNAIDINQFLNSSIEINNYRKKIGVKPQTTLVAFIGRLVEEKGINQLIRCASILQSENILIAIAGDGPLLYELNSKQLSNIKLLGNISQSEVSLLLSAADIFCLPSRSEGFSTALLEAAAAKTAPIITNVGGVEELIPNNNYGIVLENQEPSRIAEAISYLNENPQETKAIGQNIFERVKSLYSWENTAQALISACKDAN